MDEPFSTEFDSLSSLCAKNIFMNFNSSFPVKVLNSQVVKRDSGYHLNNLPYEGAVWLAFEIEVTHSNVENGDVELNLGTLTVQYMDLDGEEQRLEKSFALPAMPAGAYADLVDNPEVAQRIVELQASELQTQAKNAARHHDWDTVDRLVKEVLGLGPSGKQCVDLGCCRRTKDTCGTAQSAYLCQRAMYSARRMQKRHMSSLQYDCSMDVSIADDDAVPSFLSRKARQGKARRKKGGDGNA